MEETAETIDNENVTRFNLIHTQALFLESKVRHPAFVGGWGTGKTAMGIMKSMRLSEGYKDNLGIIFRREYTDLRDSTIVDFQTYTGMKVNSNREVVLDNGSIIKFRHLEELNNIQNINLGWFMIEQAEELDSEEPFFKLWGRLRRKGYPHCGMVIANTNGHNWIYRNWKLHSLVNGELFEATTHDNAHNLDPAYVQSLEILKEKKPSVYRRFVLNSWDDSDTRDIIISPRWVEIARARELNIQPPIRKVVTIDVARYGDDKTVFYALEMGMREEVNTLGKEQWDKKSTMETVGLATIFARKHGEITTFAVDEIGVGSGVVDRLNELGFKVIPINSSKKSTIPGEFYNIRAEMYQRGSDRFEAGKVQLLPEDEELHEELCWAKYKTVRSSGVYQVEAKDDIKKRFGRSPDSADAFLAGMWALPRVEVASKRDRYYRDRDGYIDEDPMAV